jgi:hypothetical protein
VAEATPTRPNRVGCAPGGDRAHALVRESDAALCLRGGGDPSKDAEPPDSDADAIDIDTDDDTVDGDTVDDTEDPSDDTDPPDDDTDPPDDTDTCAPTGFADTPTPWELPPAYDDAFLDPYGGTDGFGNCQVGRPSFAFVRLDDDPWRDLVVTQEPCTVDDQLNRALGYTHWDVYLGGPGGVAQTPVTWPLPQDYAAATYAAATYDPFSNMDELGNCALGPPTYTVMDMTGDRMPDLVVHDEPCLSGPLGRARWDVYVNTGTGFASTPTPWPLPQFWNDATFDPFRLTWNYAECGSGPGHFIQDVTGDRRPDLIILDEPCRTGDLGRTHWDVFVNTGSGFAATATRFDLPTYAGPAIAADPFGLIAQAGDCQANAPTYALVELTGDLVPELVITQEPCGVGPVGRDHWDVYVGSPTGFASIPEQWLLPTTYGAGQLDPFPTVSGEGDCGNDRPRYRLANFVGTRGADLVVTQEPCGQGPLGRQHWDVYEAGADRFRAAIQWSLPDDYDAALLDPMSDTLRTAECAQGWPTFAATRWDDDRVPDLLLMDEPCGDGPLGRERWDVYEAVCP